MEIAAEEIKHKANQIVAQEAAFSQCIFESYF